MLRSESHRCHSPSPGPVPPVCGATRAAPNPRPTCAVDPTRSSSCCPAGRPWSSRAAPRSSSARATSGSWSRATGRPGPPRDAPEGLRPATGLTDPPGSARACRRAGAPGSRWYPGRGPPAAQVGSDARRTSARDARVGCSPGGHLTTRNRPVRHADTGSLRPSWDARLPACRSRRCSSRAVRSTSCACAAWRAVLVAALCRPPPASRVRVSARPRHPAVAAEPARVRSTDKDATHDHRSRPGGTHPRTRGAPPRRGAGRPGRPRGEGQWALGFREPLNPNERTKKDDDGLNVRARIENVYSHRGFDSIDPSDLRGRFRWWGLYTQRAEGIDGGRTATIEPEELDAPFFMLRVRIDGGRLTLPQLRAVADVSTTYARDSADVTDRQNVQLHWIRVEDVPAIWERLESVGLTTAEACGDTPRVILGSPVAGVDPDEIVDGTPGHRGDPPPVRRRPPVLQPAAQVQDRDQRLAAPGRRARGQRPVVRRRTTPRARARASTSGSAAACRPTRTSPSGSARSSPSTRCPRCGPASSASSATTGTGGCAPRPG